MVFAIPAASNRPSDQQSKSGSQAALFLCAILPKLEAQGMRSGDQNLDRAQESGSTRNQKQTSALSHGHSMEEIRMKKTLAVLATVGALAATTVAAPAPAQARGIGPGLAFGLAAGALAAGAAGAYGPYYGYRYGPGYGYYGPRYYGPAYYGGPYAYYGGPYYRHRYWRHHW
jgi:hypothetical protein